MTTATTTSHQLPQQAAWIDLAEAARRLKKSEGHLRRLCGQWASTGRARLVKVAGKRASWQVRGIDGLSTTQPAGLPTFASGPTPLALAGDDIRGVPGKYRALVISRKQILDQWHEAIAAAFKLGFNKDQATAQFLMLHHENDLCRRTLYNWESSYKKLGFAGLLDRRGQAETMEDDDPFFVEIQRLYLRQSKPKLSTCYDMAVMMAQDYGWKIVSYRRIAQRIKTLAPAHVLKLRHGDSAFTDQAEPYIQRDYSALRSNQIWCADHHIFDVMVRIGQRINKITGEVEPIYGRPWLTAWQDVASRKIVGWVIRYENPNTDVILQAMKRGCETHGIPETVYTDNGKDFDAAVLTGETKAARWKRRKVRVELDQPRMSGVYTVLETKHQHAQPFHGQSKPIERFFGTVEDRFGKLFHTYCGRNASEKPEDLAAKLASGKHVPAIQEFAESFSQWLEADYHHRIHTGDSMMVTPSQAWEQKLVSMRKASPEVLEVMLQKKIGPVAVGQVGVRYMRLYFGSGNLELCRRLGQKVFIRVDDSDLSKVSVWDLTDKFVCVATQNHKLPFASNSADLRAALTEKARERKALLAAIPARRRQHENLPQRMIRAAQEKAKNQPQPTQPDWPPPSIKPVRSDLEGQVDQLRKAEETAKLKKAAGDGVEEYSTNFGHAFKRPTPQEDQEDSFGGFGFPFQITQPTEER